MKVQSKVAIIGAGPAGVAAAVQLKRFGLRPLLFEKTRVGGLLNNAYLVENYPGFPKGISGVSLARKLKQHLSKWHISLLKKRVNNVRWWRNNFVLEAGRTYTAQFLVVASGTKPRLPEIDLNGFDNKIFFEVYPLRNKKNKRIVIVGTGDAALDYALNLGRNNKIIIINRDKKIKGLDLLFKRIKQSYYRKNITYMPNTSISTIEQLNNCSIVKLSNGKSRSCDFLLFAIGREPTLDFLSSSIRRKFPDGDKRIFFIGDVRQGNLRQTGIAIGDGIQAAMRIHEYLKVL